MRSQLIARTRNAKGLPCRIGAVCALVLSLTAFLSVASATSTGSADSVGTRLGRAWGEYGFQNWSVAKAAFESIAETENATDDQVLQARIGVAFVTQYRMPGRDPDAAFQLYEELHEALQDAPPALKALALSQMGSCRAEQAKPDLEEARRYFREAMQVDDMTSEPSQEAALNLATTYLAMPDRAAFRQASAVLDEIEPKLKGTLFEAITYALQAEVSLWLGEPEKAAAAYEEQMAAGIENRSFRNRAMFRIARINERATKDHAKAAHWYQRLHDEIPTSAQADWSGRRAAALREGSE